VKLTSFISEFRLLSVAALFPGSYYFFKSLLYSLFCSLFREVIHHFLFSFFFVVQKFATAIEVNKRANIPAIFILLKKEQKFTSVCLPVCVCVCVGDIWEGDEFRRGIRLDNDLDIMSLPPYMAKHLFHQSFPYSFSSLFFQN
jgi:hypothetical protein